jgi:hypothetical protein
MTAPVVRKECNGTFLGPTKVLEPGGSFRGLSGECAPGKKCDGLRCGQIRSAEPTCDACLGRTRKPDAPSPFRSRTPRPLLRT